jgi:restriction system protein
LQPQMYSGRPEGRYRCFRLEEGEDVITRRSDNIIDDIAEITSKFPWWVGIALAMVSFLFLNWFAGKELPVATGVDGPLKNMLPSLLRTFASFGQFIVPAPFLLGSVVSVILNFKRAKLYDKKSHGASKDSLNDMSRHDFEFLVGEYFRRRHFSVEETKSGVDGGVDLIAKKDRETYLIQCKHWKAYKVGVKVVRELLGVMVGAGATGGIVVTSGEFTNDAVAFARANNIILLDGKELHNNMKSFIEFENQSEKKTGGKLQKVMWIFVILLVVVLCYFLFQPSKSEISHYTNLSTKIMGFLAKGLNQSEIKNTPISKPSISTDTKDMRFTDGQVKNAKEEVIREKRNQQFQKIETVDNGKNEKYNYEIELFSGGMIRSDNIEITNEKITYKSENGLVVSLNKDEVKTINKTRVVK